ncbi:MAG: hypothetical protein IJY34_00780 [Clostridia bacterium]|nr:hypothetical protein [Clostridia bacterium]
MGKMLECIFAYICKNHYAGECSPADQFYTVTEGSSEEELSILSQAVQSVGRAELAKIDAEKGVSLQPRKAEPSFDLSSYTYLPARSGSYGVFSCASLRKSLRSKNIRGSKELTHALAFDKVEEDFYAVDLCGGSRFSRYRDIRLDEDGGVALENEDLVCEVQPDELSPIGWEDFSSTPLTGGDIERLGRKGTATLAEFAHALICSVKDNRTLYVIYDPEEYDTVLAYFKAVLKLFPAAVANRISFITALGKTSRVNVQLCGVPTSDEEYISTLKRDGNVIKLTGFDVVYHGGKKGAFAAFLASADRNGVEGWLEAFERYKTVVGNVEDMDVAAALYANILGKEFNVNDLKQALKDVSACIETVESRFDAIVRIEGELAAQLAGLTAQTQYACGAFAEYSVDEIESRLLVPLVRLYQKCLDRAEGEAEQVLLAIRRVLFGLSGQTKELEKKHYEVLSVCHRTLKTQLGRDYVRFLQLIEREWSGLQPFFERYLNEPRYSEAAAEIMISFLEFYMEDFASAGRARAAIRDFFVTQYLEKNPERFAQILNVVFASVSGGLQEELAYTLDTLIGKKMGKRSIWEERVKYFCTFVQENRIEKQALEYARNRYGKQFSEDEVLSAVFAGLLANYLAVPKDATLENIYNAHLRAQTLLGEGASVSLKQFVYEAFAEFVAKPHFAGALKKLRYEAWSEDDEQNYREFAFYLRSPSIRGIVEEKTIRALEDTLENYAVYKAQTKKENEILRGRIEFVVREFLLLENKTIYKILQKYRKDGLQKALEENGITGKKPYKNPKFLEFAEREATAYLLNRDNNERSNFCQEVREERKRIFRDVGVGVRDFVGSFVGSAIFAAVMALLVWALGNVVCNELFQGYFKSLYIILVGITLVVSFVLFWTNYKDRRLRSIWLMSAWQALLFVVAVLGIFLLTQYAMMGMGL